jgi:hypothetical protein
VATTEKVGTIYEVGINGVGYMLADNAQRPVRRQTGVLDTQPPGSDDPLSERIGRYDFIGMSDFTGGEGQTMADRPRSDVTRYFYSEGLDPFTTPGQLQCLRISENLVPTAYNIGNGSGAASFCPGVVGKADTAYVQTDDAELTDQDGTAFSTGHAGTIHGMAFDGTYWYATDTLTVRRNNASADPAVDWSTTDVVEIAWCDDRLVGNSGFAGTTVLVEFDAAGVSSVIDGAHPAAGNMQGIAGGDGYVWYGVNGTGSTMGAVYYWQKDADPANVGIALALPEDESVTGIYYYLGNVFVGTRRIAYVLGSPGAIEMKVYRCVHAGDGTLVPQLVTQTMSNDRLWFAGIGKFVAFNWMWMESAGPTSGVGLIDLETGGFARWAVPIGVGILNVPRGIIAYDGGLAYFIDDTTAGGLWWCPDPESRFIPVHVGDIDFVNGELHTSTSDLGTPALKHLDEILVSSLPLPATATIVVAYSIDGGVNYTTAATFSTTAATQHSVKLATQVTASSFRFKITLNASSTGQYAPVVTAFLAKTHATGIVDDIIELPINCEDIIGDVGKRYLAEDSGPGKGMERYRTLKALTGTKVEFQDVDWKHTGDTELWEVVGVEATQVQVHSPRRNINDVTNNVAIVTLRRPSSSD